MEIIRRKTDYAIRAMVELACKYKEKPVCVNDLAVNCKISSHLTAKLMQKLTKAKVVESKLGPKGGYKLRKHPQKINLKQIVEAIQGPVKVNRCLIASHKCSSRKDCPVFPVLKNLQKDINENLKEISLHVLCHTKKGLIK